MNRLLPVFALFIAVGLYFLYIQPTYAGTITSQQSQISRYESALQASQNFTAKQDQLIAERNKISPTDIQRIESFLPDSVDNVQLILDLNSLAAKSGVSLSNFLISDNATAGAVSTGGTPATVGATAGTPTANTSTAANSLQSANSSAGSSFGNSSLTNSLDITVSAKGTYSAFSTFLSAAENSLRPLDITEVNLKSSANGIYTYTITFRIYWLS